MTSDTEVASISAPGTPMDDSPPAESSAQAARKVHWNLERGMSIQGAMDVRTLTRKDEDDQDDKEAHRRRSRKKNKSSSRHRGFGYGNIDATNELDRMDEHEAREERLRRARREERRRIEERRKKKEKEKDHEVAVEDSETSSLEDVGVEKGTKMPSSGGKNAGTYRSPRIQSHAHTCQVEADISAAAHEMDSSDDGTPDAAPGPAPATGFTQKDPEKEDAEPEMEMRMHSPSPSPEDETALESGSESSSSESDAASSEGERAGKRQSRRPGGVLSAILGGYGSREDTQGVHQGLSGRLLRGHRRRRRELNHTSGEDTSGGEATRERRRGRRRPSLRVLRRRRRWDEHSLFAKSLSDAGTTSASDSGTDTSGSSRESEHKDKHRHHRRRYPGHSGKRDDPDVQPSVQDQMVENAHGLASASSSRRSSQTTLTDTHPASRRSSHASDRSSLRSRDPRHWSEVRKNRRAMKEDLNEPYIPAHRSGHTDPTDPGSSLKVNQYWDSLLRFCRLRSRGHSTEEAERLGVQTGQNRTIAALIIATSGLAGPAAPRLAHFAPASGRDAETNKGQRKLAEYTNPREKDARAIMEMTEDARQEAQEMGVPLDGKEKVELANEALMQVDQERGKGKPLRGRRHQREIKITRHISNILERQEFIEHLAKALVK